MNPPETQLTTAPQPDVAARSRANVSQLPPSHLQTCDSCDAPLDALQRYCLNCGTRSRYVSNPAVEFLASKRKPTRLTPKSALTNSGIGGTGVTKQALPWLIGTGLIALILGVFIGQGSGNDTDKLAAALAAQKPPVVNVGGGGATTATATADVTLTSDYSLAEGYAVQLQTIPQAGADQAAVDAAKAAATAKGATAVGFINPSDHAVTPDPGADKYVIYSGEFKKKPDAEKALKKLKAKFPDATVVAVKASAGEGGTELGTGTNGKAVHSAKDYKPSAKRVAEDKKKVEDLQDKTGEDYRKAQNDLPAEIDIPGDPNNAPALPDPSAPQP